jgi:hypothetical protein
MLRRMSHPENKVALYLLAGVATAPNFMEDFCSEMVQRFRQTGWEVQVETLFPYGDWSRSLIKQIDEIRYDLVPGLSRRHSPIGGRRVADAIKASYRGGTLVIIGHSGGGVAGVHAAQILSREGGIPVTKIVQIGSPKCAVPQAIRTSVFYVCAMNRKGQQTDPVTRLGSWGGWERSRMGMPRWNPRLSAPFHIMRVPIIGGHADYFRRKSPFINEDGLSNLEITTNSVWAWLMSHSSVK